MSKDSNKPQYAIDIYKMLVVGGYLPTTATTKYKKTKVRWDFSFTT